MYLPQPLRSFSESRRWRSHMHTVTRAPWILLKQIKLTEWRKWRHVYVFASLCVSARRRKTKLTTWYANGFRPIFMSMQQIIGFLFTGIVWVNLLCVVWINYNILHQVLKVIWQHFFFMLSRNVELFNCLYLFIKISFEFLKCHSAGFFFGALLLLVFL